MDLTGSRGTYGSCFHNLESLEVPLLKIPCSVHLAHPRLRVKAATLWRLLGGKYLASEETTTACCDEVSFTDKKFRIPLTLTGCK